MVDQTVCYLPHAGYHTALVVVRSRRGRVDMRYRHLEADVIEELDCELSLRSCRFLKKAGIDTIGDLIAKSEEDLIGIPGFRDADLADVKEVLGWYGFTLKN